MRCDTWLHLASVSDSIAPNLLLIPQQESPFARLLAPPCVTTVHKTRGGHARLGQCDGLRRPDPDHDAPALAHEASVSGLRAAVDGKKMECPTDAYVRTHGRGECHDD